MASSVNNNSFSLWRLYLVSGLFVVAFLALGWRAISLQVIDKGFLLKEGDVRTIRSEKILAHRGMITDRNGEPLAVSAPVDTIWINPRVFAADKTEIPALAQKLGMSSKALLDKLQAVKGRGFAYLKRKMPPSEADQIMALGIDGINRQREYKRFYPSAEVSAHIVGFADIDEVGREGIELAYNEWLEGRPGTKKVLKNPRGGVIKDLGLVNAAEPGKDLRLSIDLRIQYLAYRELKAAVTAHKAKAGSLVVLDVETGGVLAMVNQPSYNPNNRSSLEFSSLRNRAITDVFEPGSTMKAVTLAAALESGKFGLNSVINTSPGYMRLGRRTIRDHRDYGRIPVSQVISKSSNVGASKMALAITGEALFDMYYRLGFGRATGIGFPGESIGSLPSRLKWKPVQVATLSYGYGVNVSLLQLAQAYLVFASDGVKQNASLLAETETQSGEQVIPRQVARQVRKALAGVVAKGGTGTRARVPYYPVGGKTGTVHAVGVNGYEDSQYRALFAGIAPIDEPKVVVAVMIDSPAGAEYYGGEVAAPVFSRVVAGTLRLMNVAPDEKMTAKMKSTTAQAGPTNSGVKS